MYDYRTLTIIILASIIAIYQLIVAWIIIKKSGDKGWKILIPFYGIYTFYKSLDSTGLFWGAIITSFVESIITSIINNNAETSLGVAIFGIIVTVISLIIQIAFQVKFAKNTAACFGKSGGFTAGLFFLTPVFQGILAFGKARHYNQPEEIQQ